MSQRAGQLSLKDLNFDGKKIQPFPLGDKKMLDIEDITAKIGRQ